MLKRSLAAALCGVITACSLVSCGKDISVDESDSSGSSSSSSSQSAEENVDIANFTAPEKGDTVVIMNIKDYGEVRIRLFPEYADKGVENFVTHAKEGYYDGLTFHRVIEDFMIQGGDPLGTGTGGESIWGGKFDGGTDPHLIHAAGAVAYANSGSTATDGSQFYIVTGEKYTESDLTSMAAYYGFTVTDQKKDIYTTVGGAPFLDGNYTVFGQVYQGLDIIFKIQSVATDALTESNPQYVMNRPLEDVIMESVTVGEYDGEELKWYIDDYEDFEPATAGEVETEDIPVANFTEPEEGEKIAELKIEGYDETVKIKLFPEYAEKGVDNFIQLAEQGYYDGLTFHRIIKDFMIQGGDPLGTGTGGESVWGGSFDGGTDSHLIHAAGAIAYANSGSTATDGSQFYIVTGKVLSDDDIASYESNGFNFTDEKKEIYKTVGGTPWLDGGYTVFGQVYDGLDIIFDVQNVEVDNNDKPEKDVVIESITINDYDGGDIRWKLTDYQ